MGGAYGGRRSLVAGEVNSGCCGRRCTRERWWCILAGVGRGLWMEEGNMGVGGAYGGRRSLVDSIVGVAGRITYGRLFL